MTPSSLTEQSRALFVAFAEDADNWSGEPCVDAGNVPFGTAERGNLTQLKRAGLVTTFVYDRHTWIRFTAAGKAFAAECGVKAWSLR